MIAKILSLIEYKQRIKFFILFALMLVLGVIELIGVSSLIPFLNLVSLGDISKTDDMTQYLYNIINPESFDSFLLFSGSAVLALILISNILKAVVLYFTSFFVWNNQATMALRLLKIILNRPYEVFADENSTESSKDILFETEKFVTGLLHPVLIIISQSILALSIVLVLLFYNIVVAALVVGVTVFIFGLYSYSVQRPLHRMGIQRFKSTADRFKIVDESLSGIKLIKLLNKEDFFAQQLEKPSRYFASSMAYMTVVRNMPRYIFEVVVFGSLIILILFSLKNGSNIGEILPTIGLFAFAGYRLLPTVSTIYQSFSSLTFNSIVLDKLYSQRQIFYQKDSADHLSPCEYLEVGSDYEFIFDNVSYKYPLSTKSVLNKVSFRIKSPSFLGIVGTTGSGKSTFIDLLLGLLPPSSGKITLNGNQIENYSRKSFSSKIGYVPQDIYLLDDSIANNIALGIDEDEINLDRIKTVAKLADIHDFISENLDEGYNSIVGERGARLSGGQVQRIGIARSLYNNPQIVILDEGTSNLDQATEAKILNNLNESDEIKLLIIIAHRLVTTEKCDQLLLFKDGSLMDQGTFSELRDRNEFFKEIAQS